jgi:hypothetical protein
MNPRGMDAAGFEPEGGSQFDTKDHGSCIHPQANPTPASKLVFVISPEPTLKKI